ncbi:protein ALP1-like [Cheilinus undulatus]|uniref:protein ALP1-like n=1 Tax=Cheilinus undulatus TaxID=241271 RepID=UPI001BD681A3|nr:protein ALP1-like [Cheilinus undulatus]
MEEKCTLLYGLFELFRRRSQSQLRRCLKLLEMRKRRKRRRAMVFLPAVLATGQERKLWMHVRSQDWWSRVETGLFTDEEWLSCFRMRRRTFDLICGKLRPFLQKKSTQLRQAIPLEKRVAVAILYLASGSDFKTLSELFGIGKATVSSNVWEVCTVIRKLQRQFICLPRGEKLQEVVAGFEEKWGFPQCAGVIDVCHISITAPANNAKDYSRGKGCYSIILQAVVDHLSRFTNINVGWAGSVHDARVLRNSSLFELAESNNLFPPDARQIEGVEVPLMLLGDSEYPLLSWLMKGYPGDGNLTVEQKNFNYRLSHAQTTVKNAFGRLKGRWRCLLKRMDVNISRVPTIISICCVLHNLCEIQGDEFLDEWMEGVDEPAELRRLNTSLPQETETEPQIVRQALTTFFTEDRKPVFQK